jgi:hypothetical protein
MQPCPSFQSALLRGEASVGKGLARPLETAHVLHRCREPGRGRHTNARKGRQQLPPVLEIWVLLGMMVNLVPSQRALDIYPAGMLGASELTLSEGLDAVRIDHTDAAAGFVQIPRRSSPYGPPLSLRHVQHALGGRLLDRQS